MKPSFPQPQPVDLEPLKRAAAEAAADRVASGMVVGLGTGSTARYAIEQLGRRLTSGELTDIVGIPTSEATAALAARNGVPLASLDDRPLVDLTIDGADEVSPSLDLVKGMGGALVREKIVAAASRQLLVAVDETKLVARLGSRSPLPVALLPFGAARWVDRVALPGPAATLGVDRVALPGPAATLRREPSGQPFVTDDGLWIAHLDLAGGIEDAVGAGAAPARSARRRGHRALLGHGQYGVRRHRSRHPCPGVDRGLHHWLSPASGSP